MIQFQSFRVNASTAGDPVNFISSVVGFSNEVNGIDITTQCNYIRFSGSNSAEWARFSNCNLTVANNVGFSNTLTGPYIVASNVTASNVTALSIISSTHTTSNMTVSSNITVPYITASNVVASNVNFTGSLLQNGVAYVGSQWSGTTGGPISYYGGTVSASNLSVGSNIYKSLTNNSPYYCYIEFDTSGSMQNSFLPFWLSCPVARILPSYLSISNYFTSYNFTPPVSGLWSITATFWPNATGAYFMTKNWDTTTSCPAAYAMGGDAYLGYAQTNVAFNGTQKGSTLCVGNAASSFWTNCTVTTILSIGETVQFYGYGQSGAGCQTGGQPQGNANYFRAALIYQVATGT